MKRLLSISLALPVLLGVSIPLSAQQANTLSKEVLLQLSRDQSRVLCQSEVFTHCMGFEQKECLDLSEKALQTCLGPLPDPIKLSQLRNETLEACPQAVYTEAGYAEEKAKDCIEEAMK